MEICVLKFEDTHDADDALEHVLDAEGSRRPWLHDVAVVRRPLLGRITIRATFAEDGQPTEWKQGALSARALDAGAMTGYAIGSLFGPFHADMSALAGAERASSAAAALENKLMFIDEIKQLLPRGSSALVLVAAQAGNDEFVQLFSRFAPQIVRHDLATEVEKRLNDIQTQLQTAVQVSP